MFSNLLNSVNKSIYAILDDLVFIDTTILDNLTNIIGINSNTGITLICNALVYGFLIYYCISYLLSFLTFSQIEKPFQFIFKLLLCVLALNCSEFICSAIISLFSNISLFIRELGLDLLGVDISFSSLVDKIYSNIYFENGEFNLFSFDGILKSLTSIGFINLIISYSIRYVMIKVLVILAPFAILCLCNNKTSSFFKSWFRIFLAMMFLQVFVSIILAISFTVTYDENSLISEMLHIGIVYSLVKSNSFVKDLIGGFSTDVSFNLSSIYSIFNRKG